VRYLKTARHEMNEKELILTKGEQPVATFSEEELDFLISREFPGDKEAVKTKLDTIKSNSQSGENRFSAAVLKLAHRDFNKVDLLIKLVNEDFRDIASEAEYPRAHKTGFELFEKENKVIEEVLLADWENYSNWKEKT
jgi:hypothetical protein